MAKPTDLCTTTGEDPDTVRARQTNETGQHDGYVILCARERKKGFVRPYRDTYVHVGPTGPVYPTIPVSDGPWDAQSKEGFLEYGYVAWEPYPAGTPEAKTGSTGRLWTQAQLDQVNGGCGCHTTMSRPLAETYARDPRFYQQTFCVNCNTHLPVDEFVWEGTDERVGS